MEKYQDDIRFFGYGWAEAGGSITHQTLLGEFKGFIFFVPGSWSWRSFHIVIAETDVSSCN